MSVSVSVLCSLCNPARLGWLFPDSVHEPEQHCYGEEDTPGHPGVMGSGVVCPCECRRWPHQPKELWDLAAAEHPEDPVRRGVRFRELLVEHRHAPATT